MIEYILKTILCSGLLYVAYLAFFRGSTSFKANRFILLFSVLFSLLVPLIHISSSNALAQQVIENDAIGTTLSNISGFSAQTIQATENMSETWSPSILLSIYVIISAFLLGRLCFNLYPLLSGKFVAERTTYKGQKLAVVHLNVSPFSFLRTMYVNKESFEKGEIDHELLLHESGHTRQLHSLDILFMELVQVICWFNPFIFLFKKLIKTNHEYLADEFVVNSGSNVQAYSHKLINYTNRNKTLHLGSGFNYSLIKNRLIMLSKYDQKNRFFYRISLFASLLLTLFVTTAFTNLNALDEGVTNDEKSGIFYADTLFWSEENQKVYLRGDVQIKALNNNVTGKGSFSFLGKVNLLIINGSKASLNSSIELSGMKCELLVLSEEEAQQKYGAEGKWGAVEINTHK